MKRPPGLWILLSAGVLWLSLQDVYGIRATALIFGKSTTSTTTEATSSVAAEDRIDDESVASSEATTSSSNSTSNGNSTGPVLTGNPQIDYIWDPNLPQVLKGYNLSEYPFYERVPATIEKEIDFKCDGLHDGFYASIPHKCQVYHHCLFGTRYDFLCANYTAFDQKTFICQFVSEVDCVNSKENWHRNDALYQAASTTTTASPLRANIYTTAPPDVGDPITPRRPAGGGARRPYRPRRRRPQVEYYDDEYYDDEYYDERPRATRGRKRPRPRPRPIYDDDEEYEDERYESRRGSERRGPSRKRNRPRKRPEYNDDEEVDDRFEDEDFVAANKRQKNEDKRKPPDDGDLEERDQKRTSGKRRYPSEKREQEADYDRKPPRKNSNKRPTNDDYEDELPQSDDSRNYEQRPRKKNKGNNEESPDGRPIIKPTTGTIYDRPRVAPRINLPVPKNAADKFAYSSTGGSKTTTTTKATPAADEEEYEDEVYEEPLPKRQRNRERRPPSDNKREKSNTEDSKEQPSESRPRTRKPEVEESVEKVTLRPKYASGRNRYTRPTLPSKQKPVSEEYYEDEEYLDEEKEAQDRKPSLKQERKPTSTTTSTTSSTTTTTTTTTTPAPKKEKQEPLMRVIKRPFLPSRGGSPYNSRGLQPVGLKAVDKTSEENDSKEDRESIVSQKEEADDYEDSRSNEKVEESPNREPPEVQNVRRPYFKPSPALIKVPIRPKYTPPSAEAQELIDSEPSYQQTYKTRDFSNARSTQKPKVVEKNPLDLNEYDVTLNEALNPTLPNLPVRSFPTGFSSGSDYSYNTYTRPRYVLEPIITPSNQNFVNQNKVVRSHQRYETVPQSQYTTINGGYRQPGQTQAIYSSY